MKESDLFEPTKSYLVNEMLCEEVYAEVLDIDVVGKLGNVYIGIEMKTSLNFKVIEQADRRKHLVDYMFILVPKPKSYHAQIILNWLHVIGVGLIYYDEKARYYESSVQRQFWGKRHKHRDYIEEAIERDKALHLVNIGGVKGGESITPYKSTVDKIKHYLYYQKDGATIDQILERVQTHYSSPKPSTIATLQAHWNQEWCEIVYIDGVRHFKMKEESREPYWNEYMKLSREIRALRRAER